MLVNTIQQTTSQWWCLLPVQRHCHKPGMVLSLFRCGDVSTIAKYSVIGIGGVLVTRAVTFGIAKMLPT